MSILHLNDLESAITFSLKSIRGRYWFDKISGESFGSNLNEIKMHPLGDDLSVIENDVYESLSWLNDEITVEVKKVKEEISILIEFESKVFEYVI